MKKPYILQTVLPKIHFREIADANVHGFPRIETEKSLHTKLNNTIFSGVHN